MILPSTATLMAETARLRAANDVLRAAFFDALAEHDRAVKIAAAASAARFFAGWLIGTLCLAVGMTIGWWLL